MARRRRSRNKDSGVPGLVVISVLGLIFAYKQNQQRLILFFVIFLLFALLIVLIKLAIKMRRNDRLRRSNIEQIDNMSGLEFERYIKLLLIDRGYSRVRLTNYYDLGIDIVAEKDNETWGIQAKRYRGAVGLDAVRQAVAAVNHYKCTKAMVIANSYFTRNARTIADSMNCVLIDRDALIELILEKKRIEETAQ